MKRMRTFLWLPFIFTFVNGCDGWLLPNSLQDHGLHGETLRVQFLDHPFSYDPVRNDGFEYEILNEFAKQTEMKLQVVKDSPDVLVNRSPLSPVRSLFQPTLPYDQQVPVLICNRKDWSQRPFQLILQKDSPFNRTRISGRLQKKYAISRIVTSEIEVADYQLANDSKQSVCLVLEKTKALYDQRFFPKLEIVKDLQEETHLSFHVTMERPKLKSVLNLWLHQQMRNGWLHQTKFMFEDYLHHFTNQDSKGFLTRMKTRYPLYRHHFKTVGKEFGLQKEFLAAISYQESQWNPSARSPTGVRGLMQLTADTAEEVGIDDRLDPAQSIYGGAKYFKYLMGLREKRIGVNRVSQRQLKLMTLAAYNVGFAHITLVQSHLERERQDPLSWSLIIKTLPQLSNQDFHNTVSTVKVRGHEPVQFTRRVLNYWDLLLGPRRS